MGFFGRLFGTATAAGAGVVGVKVAEKVKENNPNGVESTTDKISAVKQAAAEVFAEVAGFVSEKAPDVRDTLNGSVQRASDFATEKMPGVTVKVQEFVEKVAEKAPGVAEKVQSAVETVVEKVAEYADSVAAPTRSAEEQFDEVVDAEFTEVCEESKEE